MTNADHAFDVRQVIPKDAIPSVDDPDYETDYAGDPDDEVVTVTVKERSRSENDADELGADGPGADAPTTRAYPVRYLHYHEIVNDVLDGVPVAVTWCPLCGSAVVYDRRVAVEDGEEATATDHVLEFGVSGKLADDDLVMYDRETGSEWKQSLGRAIAGPLAGTDLRVLPAAMTTWERFRESHPDGDVLSPPDGKSEAAGEGDEPEPIDYDDAPYEAYFEMEGFGLGSHRGEGGREWGRDDLDPKAVVLGIEHGGEAVGVPRSVVVNDDGDRGVVTLIVGGTGVVVFATKDGGIHAFRNPGYEWTPAPGGFRATRPDGSGALYQGDTGRPADVPAAHTGESGGAAAEPLERLPARRLFAFAWRDDHGDDAFYGLDGGEGES